MAHSLAWDMKVGGIHSTGMEIVSVWRSGPGRLAKPQDVLLMCGGTCQPLPIEPGSEKVAVRAPNSAWLPQTVSVR